MVGVCASRFFWRRSKLLWRSSHLKSYTTLSIVKIPLFCEVASELTLFVVRWKVSDGTA